MKPTFAVLSPLLSLLFFTSPFKKTTNFIDETCLKITNVDLNVDYNFCTSSLQSFPVTETTTFSDLGSFSITLIQENVTNTSTVIKEMIESAEVDSVTRTRLRDCLELYSDAISAVDEAMEEYEAQEYEDVNVKISSVIDASTSCEEGFREIGDENSPLTKRNNDSFQLSAIALSIVKLISN